MRANTSSNRVPNAEKVVGVAEVMTVGVRVAGQVQTRSDLRFAGTPEQMLGLSLGTVLIYLNSPLAVRTVALAWGQAAPMARSLSPQLAGPRRPVMATGPWSLTTMIRIFGTPTAAEHGADLSAEACRHQCRPLRARRRPLAFNGSSILLSTPHRWRR